MSTFGKISGATQCTLDIKIQYKLHTHMHTHQDTVLEVLGQARHKIHKVQ